MNQNDHRIETGRRHYYLSSQGPFYNANNILMFYGGGHRGGIVETIVSALPDTDQVFHIHGEPGSGKTMLSLVISDRIKHQCHTIRYDLPEVSASRLLRHLLIELCPQSANLITSSQAQKGADKASIDAAVNCIGNQIIANRSVEHSKPYALFIDSPGVLNMDALRVIDQLNSLRVGDRAGIHCIVFHPVTHPVGRNAMSTDSEFQSDNHFWLRRLTLAEIEDYLRHHMMLFDFNRRDLFTREMAYFIADRSDGVFCAINALARNAFTIANLEDSDRLSMSHLLMAGLPVGPEVSDKSDFKTYLSRSTIALSSICVVALLAMAVVLMR
jgi:type II secretory pathway predicted ATPase ExeA